MQQAPSGGAKGVQFSRTEGAGLGAVAPTVHTAAAKQLSVIDGLLYLAVVVGLIGIPASGSLYVVR
jgi:hypothetical protein